LVAASLLSRLEEWSGHKEAEMAEHQTAELVRFDDAVEITERVAVAAFLAGYTGATRVSYTTDLRIFAGWCQETGVNLLRVQRAHLELFARWMEQHGRMTSTIARRLSTLASFYRYCHTEQLIGRQRPTATRRLRVPHPRARSQRTRRLGCRGRSWLGP
jgi:site-specific recombinase XerC